MRAPASLAILALAAALAGCGSSDKKTTTATAAKTTAAAPATSTPVASTGTGNKDTKTRPTITKLSGAAPAKLETKDIVTGTGATAKAGDLLTVDYVGALAKTGKVFDASWNRSQTFQFPLGQGQVIQGWDQGIAGMKVGGRRELIIPSALGYGAQGAPPDIPANAPHSFIVDLRGIGS